MRKSIFLLVGLCLSFSFISSAQFEVYVTSGNGPSASSVKKFDATGNYLGDFIAPGTSPLNWPQDIVFIENNTIALVSGLNNNAIFRYDGSTGALIDTFAANISGPTRMKIGADGYLYALEWNGEARVMRYDLQGNFMDTFTNIAVNNSIGLDWDSAGNLYVSSYNENAVYRFDPSGNYMDTPISSGLSGPTTIWFDATGDLYVSNWNGNFVKRFDASFMEQPNNFGTISKPEGFVEMPNGDLLLGSGGPSSSVRRYDALGNFVTSFATGNGLANPNAIYIKQSQADLDEGNIEGPRVYPTIGSRFYIHGLMKSNKEEIVLTGINGQWTKRIELQEGNYFDADDLSDGVYFVSIDGSQPQRITVKK